MGLFSNRNKEAKHCRICNKTGGWGYSKISKDRGYVEEEILEILAEDEILVCISCQNCLDKLSSIYRRGDEPVSLSDLSHSQWFKWYIDAEYRYIREGDDLVYDIQTFKTAMENALNGADEQIETILKDEIANFEIAKEYYLNHSKYFATASQKIIDSLPGLDTKVWNVKDATLAFDGQEIVIYARGYKYAEKLAVYAKEEHLELKDFFDNYRSALAIINEESDILTRKYNKESIIYFQEKGGLHYTTEISGGGGTGGGVNISTALLGGIAFGPAGAIIGSSVGTEVNIGEIQSESVKHDERYVELKFNDEFGKVVTDVFSYDFYKIFLEIIPDKEYSYVKVNPQQINRKVVKPVVNDEMVNQLRSLKLLLDEGIITEEEFNIKKQAVLSL